MRALRVVVLGIGFAAGCGPQVSRAVLGTPQDGLAVLARMHARYSDSWYRTVTFLQRTTQRQSDGTERVSTWYEAQSGDRLRIDIGNPADGNGALYTADSMYVVRDGKVVRARAEGNPFLPLISGVYLQPLDVTVRQLAPYKVNLNAVHTRIWGGQRTFVIGTTSPSDSTSPQVWVEADRLIVTRFLMKLFPESGGGNQDVRLEKNVEVDGGWLATRVRILDKGVPVQVEEYSDWHTGVALPPTFFQVERWKQDPHWYRATGGT
jgi:hypothetical protein